MIGALPTTTASAVHWWRSASRATRIDSAVGGSCSSTTATPYTTGNGASGMAHCDTDAGIRAGVCAALCSGRQSAVWSRCLATFYTRAVAGGAMDTAAKHGADSSGGNSSSAAAASAYIAGNDIGSMAYSLADAAHKWLAGSGVCSRQSTVWARSVAHFGTSAVANNITTATANRTPDPSGNSCSRRQSAIRSELGLGSYQSVAGDWAGFTGEKAFTRDTWAERRQAAKPSRRTPRDSSLVATAAPSANFLRALDSTGCDCCRRQSAVWHSTAVQRSRAVAGQNAHKDRASVSYSRVYCGCSEQSAVWHAAGLALSSPHYRMEAGRPVTQAVTEDFTGRTTGSCKQSAVRDASQMVRSSNFSLGTPTAAPQTEGTAFAWNTRAIGRQSYRPDHRSTLVKRVELDNYQHRSGCPADTAASGRQQSAFRDASRLALFRSNRSVEAGRAITQAATEDLTGRTAAGDCSRPEMEAKMAAWE